MIVIKKKNPTKKKGNQGFSLAEVVTALTVLAVLFTAAFGALHQAIQINANSRLRSDANEILRNQTEALRSLSWAEITALPNAVDLETTDYDNRLSAVLYLNLEASGLICAKILVRWTDINNTTHNVSVVTLISNGGISAS